MAGVAPARLGLFEAFGIELEYMIVDAKSLEIAPLADMLLERAAGAAVSEFNRNGIGWSNEFVLHVIEFKNDPPVKTLNGLAARFQEQVAIAEDLLKPLGARLMPGAMHPWMQPQTQTHVWPHEQNEVYQAYNRIFDSRGHGWANVQSTHINLPFDGEDQFVRLHAAVRVVLGLIPGLAASSPVFDGRLGGLADQRLEFYRSNQARVPSITGRVIPEAVNSIAEYHERILGRIYRDIAPYDHDGILQHEWLNSRGAIARFDRAAIEIRVADIQECPRADLAVVAAVIALVKALCEERWVTITDLNKLTEIELEAALLDGIRWGSRGEVQSPGLLKAVGLDSTRPIQTRQLWSRVFDDLVDPNLAAAEGWDAFFRRYNQSGTLAERITESLRPLARQDTVLKTYRRLVESLSAAELF